MSRVVCWFSCGAASAVAAKLALQRYRGEREVVIAYCATNGEHPDNARFMADAVRWFNQDVVTVASTKYSSVWDLWEKRRFLSGVNGALCTSEMKVAPRMKAKESCDAKSNVIRSIGRGKSWNRRLWWQWLQPAHA